MADWTKVEQLAKDALLPVILTKLESLGVDGMTAATKAQETVALGARLLARKLQGEDVSGDLGFIEGTLWGIAANTFAKETDKVAWVEFAKTALQVFLQVLPAILIAVL